MWISCSNCKRIAADKIIIELFEQTLNEMSAKTRTTYSYLKNQMVDEKKSHEFHKWVYNKSVLYQEFQVSGTN